MRPRPDGMSQAPGTGGEAARWQEAARLRREHTGWIVIWLAREDCFRAYRRLPGARSDTALSAVTAADMAAQIRRAEQASARPARHSPEPA